MGGSFAPCDCCVRSGWLRWRQQRWNKCRRCSDVRGRAPKQRCPVGHLCDACLAGDDSPGSSDSQERSNRRSGQRSTGLLGHEDRAWRTGPVGVLERQVADGEDQRIEPADIPALHDSQEGNDRREQTCWRLSSRLFRAHKLVQWFALARHPGLIRGSVLRRPPALWAHDPG